MTINILDSDWTKHYSLSISKCDYRSKVHARLTLLLNTSVYPKIVTEKVQVAYFENVFSDWSIFKEAVLLSNQRFPFKRVSASRTKTTKNGSSGCRSVRCRAEKTSCHRRRLWFEATFDWKRCRVPGEPPIQLYVHLKLICVKSYQMKTSRKWHQANWILRSPNFMPRQGQRTVNYTRNLMCGLSDMALIVI